MPFVARPMGALVACAAAALWLGAAPASSHELGTDRASAAVLALADGDFQHRAHVPIEWIRVDAGGRFVAPETQRDCRGCHAFHLLEDGREVSRDPQPLCVECHYPAADGKPTLDLAAKVDWQKLALTKYRAPDEKASSFTHGDHGKLDCRECHAGATVKQGGQDFVDDVMPIPRGTTWCVSCHDPRVNGGDVFAAMMKKLDGSPRMAHADRFLHNEHYRISAEDSAGGCDGCHQLSQSLAKDLETKEYDAATCAPCHKPQDVSQPIAFAFTDTKTESAAALCFDHKDHLTRRALEDPEIKAKGCLACHVYDERAATYALAEGFGDYAACASCHDRAAKADVAALSPAGAAKLPPVAKDHGKWTDAAGWGSCHLCHALDGPSAASDAPRRTMKDNRPLASKARPRAGLFRITSQAHRHVTSSNGNPVDERCSTCHPASLPSLPSRVTVARFDHASHVPKIVPPGVDACASCHQGPVYAAKTSDQIGRTYDPASCKQCHLGAEPTEEPPLAEASRAAPPVDFNHALHLGKNHPARKGGQAALMNCADCHDATAPFADGASGAIGVKAGAASCIDCHRHDEAAQAITGGKGTAEVEGCVRCHETYVPNRGEVVFTSRRSITGLSSGKQLHEPKTGESCEGCHKVVDRPRREFRDENQVHVKASAKGRSPHGASNTAKYPAGESCAECHWSGWAAYPDGTLSDDLRGKQGKIGEVRTRDGKKLVDFPGLKKGG